MTTPPYPSENQPEHPENQGYQDNQYPSYPATPHPEDAPGYGQQGYQGYQGYQAYPGYGGHDAYGTPGEHGALRQGDGKVRPMEAVGWAFRTVFRNPLIWILGALLIGVASVALSMSVDFAFGGLPGSTDYQMSVGYQIIQLLMVILVQALGIFIYHGALKQVEQRKIGLGDFFGNVNFWPAFGVAMVIQVLAGVLFTAVLVPLILGGNDIANMEMASQDEAMAFLAKIFFALGVVLLISLLLAPLTMFMVWFAVDRRASFGGSFGAGFRAGARNFLPLLVYNFVAGLVAVILAVITFGLAMPVIIPALLLAQAYMYRQAAPGALPAPER